MTKGYSIVTLKQVTRHLFRNKPVCLLLLIGLSACNSHRDSNVALNISEKPSATSARQMQRNVQEELLRKLHDAPAWSQISEVDTRKKKELLKALMEVAKLNIGDIRDLLLRYIRQASQAPGGMDIDMVSKVFVLNRLLFAVPESVPIDRVKFFGGWSGVPQQNKLVNMMWPLAFEPDGDPILVGHFGGYYGDVYDALAEFEYFKNEYGIRPRFRLNEASVP